VIVSLARDESQTVRLGVLEALAEVIYTFHDDPNGPPAELLRLFLGIREEDDVRKVEEKVAESPPPSPPATPMSWSEFMSSISSGMNKQEYDIYDDPSRPLVCAFNYPAVALTLGRDRWHEIRELYLSLAQNPSLKVRRTLAASLGEMAKILGPAQTKEDLIPVWQSAVRSEEGEVRLKAVECLETFIHALGEIERAEVLKSLNGDVWPRLKGWREREAAMKVLATWVTIPALDETVLRGLLRKGLQDTVASVRDESVDAVSIPYEMWDEGLITPHSLLLWLLCGRAGRSLSNGFGTCFARSPSPTHIGIGWFFSLAIRRCFWY
jgi:serine/threonine-protein phosphatase 4 regulatory subunit 1